MARNDRIVRVEALKQALCASRTGVALKTLADRHTWNLRGLYRDLKALESAGYVIDSSDHRYRILGNPRNAAGLPDADERLALYLARQNARGWKETSLGKALDRLWHRVSAAGDGQAALLPVESTPWIVTREQSGIDYGTRRSIIATLERATRTRVAVHANCATDRCTIAQEPRRAGGSQDPPAVRETEPSSWSVPAHPVPAIEQA